MAARDIDESYAEEERRRAEARARIEAEIASLQTSLDTALELKEKLVKQKDELQIFKAQFVSQFNKCSEGFNNINSSVTNISYPETSFDTSLSDLKNINESIANNVSDTMGQMQGIKNQLDNKMASKEEEINLQIDEVNKKIEDIKNQIASLQSQLSAL